MNEKEILASESENANKEDIRRFLMEAQLLHNPDDMRNIDAILQVSVAANEAVYEEVREDKEMCQALRNLMSDEIEKEIMAGKTQGTVDNIKAIMHNLKMTAEQAMNALGIAESERAQYTALL